METTYGSVASVAPEGFLPRRVHFATLVRLNEQTKEGALSREVSGNGFGTRELPLTIDGNGNSQGHEGTVPVGRLDSIKIDGNNVEAWGWMRDNEAGHMAYMDLATETVRFTSVRMTDYKVQVNIDFGEDDDLTIHALFTEAKVGGTTMVATPAFASARAKLEDELTASLAIEEDLEVMVPWTLDVPELTEMTAALDLDIPVSDFMIPEAEEKTAPTVQDGLLFGHLGTWDSCHGGWVDKCVRIPHSRTNYASFCNNKLHVQGGVAWTGPVFLLGGHTFTREAINKAMESVENAWADVTVIDGRHGPWLSGRVRPGVTPEALYAATASQLSGHWIDGELRAICSVNTGGFNTPRATNYVVEVDENGETEYLMASMSIDCGCGDEEMTTDDRLARIEKALGIIPVNTDPIELLKLAASAALIEEDEEDDDAEETATV